jgi:membrane protease YdiL (CAAX protease family)
LGKRWTEVGLTVLNLVTIVLVIAGLQPLLRKHWPSAGAAMLGLVCFGTYFAASKWIERRNPTELATGRAFPELFAGIALGALLFSAVMIVLRMAGIYRVDGWGTTNHLASGLFFAVGAGIMEEILFRGLLFRLSSKIVGTWGALVFTAALFGLAHLGNPGATLASSLAIALEAGVLLGAAYAATQRLWLPIGLHIGWNFTEGSIFGMSVSGNDVGSGLLQGSLSGRPILTGGPFGPEASIVAVILCSGAALFFLVRTVKRQRLDPPIWSHAPLQEGSIETA